MAVSLVAGALKQGFVFRTEARRGKPEQSRERGCNRWPAWVARAWAKAWGTNGNICIDSLWIEFFQQDTGPPGKKQAAGGAGKRKRLSSGTEGLGEGSRALPRAALQGPGLADSEKTPARSVPGNQTQREGTDLQCGVATSGVEVSTERSRRLTETSGSQGNFLS